MLTVRGLSRCYGTFKAVDDVSFSINQGEIVGLLGHNGAGKTTIMKMLSGYLEPDQGSVEIDGVNLADDLKTVQRGLGYLPESLPMYPEMTVADYLDYAAELKGLSGNDKVGDIRRVVEATEIVDKLVSPIATLSRGYKQRVGVAQAILGRPKLLILDEPTNGLDPTQTEHMRQLIRDIAEEATVILSTHILQEVDALCSRVLIVRDGKLVVDAELQSLRASNHLLLHTSVVESNAEKLFADINGVENLERIADAAAPEICAYRITLVNGADGNRVSAELAKVVCDNGEKLFQLSPEQRDLETLFREVSNAPLEKNLEELNNAA